MAAAAVFTVRSSEWAVGSTVNVYLRRGDSFGSSAPGPVVTTGVVAADNGVTFGNLAFSTRYWAAQLQGSVWKAVGFTTDDAGEQSVTVTSTGINVRDYGAVGDGVTNDTVAIQQAISDAGGKVVFFPQGNYYCDVSAASIVCPDTTLLIGEGPETIITLGPAASAATLSLFTTTGDAELSNMALACSSFTTGRKSAIEKTGTGEGTIRLSNVYAHGFSSIAFIGAGAVGTIEAFDSLLEGFAGGQAVINSSGLVHQGSGKVLASNCTFQAFGSTASTTGNAVQVHTVVELDVDGCTFGVHYSASSTLAISCFDDTTPPATPARLVRIASCRFLATSSAGVGTPYNTASRKAHALIKDCTFAGTREAISLLGDATIRDCRFFTAATQPAIQTQDSNGGQASASLNPDALIEGCKFYGSNTSEGDIVLRTASSRLTVRGCKFYGAPESYYYVPANPTGNFITFVGCEFLGAPVTAAFQHRGASIVTVRECIFRNTVGAAVHVRGTGAAVKLILVTNDFSQAPGAAYTESTVPLAKFFKSNFGTGTPPADTGAS
jgi:hypothetical protein